MKCPYCESVNVSNPTTTSIGGKRMTIRQCFNCFRIFDPSGKPLAEETT